MKSSASIDPVQGLADSIKKYNPKPNGTMKDYFQWIMAEVKNEPYPTSGQTIENLLSLNKEMIEFFYDLERMLTAGRHKSTEQIVAFLLKEMPNDWNNKPMVFDLVSSVDKEITKQDAMNIMQQREEIIFNGCVMMVIHDISHGNFLQATLLLSILEKYGWEGIADIAFKNQNFTQYEKYDQIKKLGMKIVMLSLQEQPKVSEKTMFSDSNKAESPAEVNDKKDENKIAALQDQIDELKPGSSDKSKSEVGTVSQSLKGMNLFAEKNPTQADALQKKAELQARIDNELLFSIG